MCKRKKRNRKGGTSTEKGDDPERKSLRKVISRWKIWDLIIWVWDQLIALWGRKIVLALLGGIIAGVVVGTALANFFPTLVFVPGPPPVNGDGKEGDKQLEAITWRRMEEPTELLAAHLQVLEAEAQRVTDSTPLQSVLEHRLEKGVYPCRLRFSPVHGFQIVDAWFYRMTNQDGTVSLTELAKQAQGDNLVFELPRCGSGDRLVTVIVVRGPSDSTENDIRKSFRVDIEHDGKRGAQP